MHRINVAVVTAILLFLQLWHQFFANKHSELKSFLLASLRLLLMSYFSGKSSSCELDFLN